MSDAKGDNAAFARLAAIRRRERDDALAQAKRDAAERGKQLFDLDKLEQLYDTHSPGGFQQPRDERERDYEYRYYVSYRETMSLAEFVAKQAAQNAGTDPRSPSGAAELAARANTLLARVATDFRQLTKVGADQARRDLGEAVQHLEAVLALITEGSEQVPDGAFPTHSARRWSQLYPDLFKRSTLTAAIAAHRARLAELGARAMVTPRVAGVEVPSAEAVAALVARQLDGGGVWSDRADYNEVDGLRRAMRDAGPLLSSFGRALVGLLAHPSVRCRTGAIAALGDAAGHVSADAAVSVLEGAPQLFRGIAPTSGLPVQGPDLEAALAQAIARLVRPADTRSTAFLRDYLARSNAVVVLLGLAEAAPDWVVANAATAVPRSAIGGVLRKLPTRDQRRAVLQALAPWPPHEGREVVAKSFWNTLPIKDEERDELKRIVSPRG